MSTEPIYKKGESVWPSNTNPHKFNKNAKFPYKVNRQAGLTLYLEHETKSGKNVIESWWIGYWQDHPEVHFIVKEGSEGKTE